MKTNELVIFGLNTGLNWHNDSLNYSQEMGLMWSKKNIPERA